MPAFANGSSDSEPSYPQLVDGNFWVDTTGQVDKSTLIMLNQKSVDIQKQGYQLGGFIFNEAPGKLVEVATEFGNRNRLGYQGKDNGIAIAVAINRKGKDGKSPSIGIAIGSGLEGLLNDGKVGRILDKVFVPARNADMWQTGLLETVDAIRGELNGENAYADPFQEWFSSLPLWGQIIFIVIAICLVLFILALGSSGSSSSSSWSSSDSSSSSGGGGGFSGGGSER